MRAGVARQRGSSRRLQNRVAGLAGCVGERHLCEAVLGLGGGPKVEQRRHYREAVENAVRESLEKSPWEALQEQVVLGSAEFLNALRKQVSR